MSAVPSPLPCHSGATPMNARYQWGGLRGCLPSIRSLERSASGRCLPNTLSIGGVSRIVAVIGTRQPSGGAHTAAPTTSSVVQTSPCARAIPRSSVSKNSRSRPRPVACVRQQMGPPGIVLEGASERVRKPGRVVGGRLPHASSRASPQHGPTIRDLSRLG